MGSFPICMASKAHMQEKAKELVRHALRTQYSTLAPLCCASHCIIQTLIPASLEALTGIVWPPLSCGANCSGLVSLSVLYFALLWVQRGRSQQNDWWAYIINFVK